MKKKRIGLVTYSECPQLSDSDTLLPQPLKHLGYEVDPVPWDDPTIVWKRYDCLILRSCWNYHLQIDAFLAWLDRRNREGIKLWNQYKTVRWNRHKSYLLDLKQKGIPIIPTELVSRHSRPALSELFASTGYPEMVIKPAVGASAYGVFSVKKEDADQKQQEVHHLLEQSDCLIQPLMKEIRHGELSIVFIGKQYSHTVLKRPANDEYRTNYAFRGSESLIQLSSSMVDQAKRVVDSVPERLLYARVDGLLVDGKFILMELELIEPHLFFDLHPPAAALFTNTFKAMSAS